MEYYECYHAVCQYSDDECDGCKYEMDCYDHFLNHVLLHNKENKENKEENND